MWAWAVFLGGASISIWEISEASKSSAMKRISTSLLQLSTIARPKYLRKRYRARLRSSAAVLLGLA